MNLPRFSFAAPCSIAIVSASTSSICTRAASFSHGPPQVEVLNHDAPRDLSAPCYPCGCWFGAFPTNACVVGALGCPALKNKLACEYRTVRLSPVSNARWRSLTCAEPTTRGFPGAKEEVNLPRFSCCSVQHRGEGGRGEGDG